MTDPFDVNSMQHMTGLPGMHDRPHSAGEVHPGGVPDVVSLLWSEYERHIQRRLDDMRARGKEPKGLDRALVDAPATHFVEFCRAYLGRHRPVQQFPADANAGFMLSNNVRALLCPPIPGGHAGPGGRMQDAGAVGVTHGRSQPGLDGVIDDGGIAII